MAGMSSLQQVTGRFQAIITHAAPCRRLQQHADSIDVLYSLFCVCVYFEVSEKSYEHLKKGTLTAIAIVPQ